MSLFDVEPLARATDPDTCRQAAERVWAGWPEKIIECLAAFGPASDDAICVRLNVDVRRWPSVKTARSRVSRAEDPAMRLIVATNRTENGQTVWRHRDHRLPQIEGVDLVGDAL